MSYVECCILAVPTGNKAAYLNHARRCAEIFKSHGVQALSENWGAEIPDGALTSLPKAVQLKPDETVVLSLMVWPDKASRDDGWTEIMDDPRMKAMGDMPFDGQRLIYGGFEPVLEA